MTPHRDHEAMLAAPVPDEDATPQSWTPWNRVDGGYAALARYVAPDAARGLDLAAGRGSDDDDLTVARRLYERLRERLRERGVAYALEPRLAIAGRQEIRAPELLLRDRVATCIDIATTYASMCLRSHVGVLLAITYDHALVLLTPGRLPADQHVQEAFRVAGLDTAAHEPEGVLRGEPDAVRLALQDGDAIALDCVTALVGDFDAALAAGLRRAGEIRHLIDVDYLHDHDFPPFAPPADRPTIHLHVPGDAGPFDDYPSHRELIEQLSGASGTVALFGASGRGKSRIARRLAEEAPAGAGWFLDASERQTLANSLAAADRAESQSVAAGLERPDRTGFAYSALARLAEMEDPWVVVLDNADGDPGKLRDLMPRPRAGQLLLITTTNPDWEDVRGVAWRSLPAVDDADVAARLGGPELVRLVGGRPLLLDAFTRLLAAKTLDATAVAACAPAGPEDAPEAGPATLWQALRASDGFDETALRVSACAAYLPPDHQPLATLEALVPGAREAVRLLVARGLLTFELDAPEDDDRAAVRMHRLFGAAVRADLEATSPALVTEVVRRLSREPAAYALLDARGDLATVNRLAALIVAAEDPERGPDPELGLALHGVAKLLELHAQTRVSGGVFGRAKRHLAGTHPAAYADCLQGQARTVNQHDADDELALREAVGWVQEAQRTILEAEGKDANAGRFRALEGLLMLKLANFPGPGQTRLQLLEEALGVIDEADRSRMARTDVDEVELARSRFNLAGPRISLAQAEPARAAEHLDIAAAVYEEVRQRRMVLYENRKIHPHVAACIHGLGLVDYYRALLVAETQAERSRLLRAATDSVVDALKQRETLEGSIDLDEVSKSAALLAKIALARHASPVAHASTLEGTVGGATRELTRARVVVASAPVLPSTAADLPAAIAAWVGSPALAVLVEQFGGTVPSGELGDVLARLDDFAAARWDFRQGRERNLVTAPQLTPATERVIRAAAKALGLELLGSPGKPAPGEPVPRYDEILILGGLVRACLARPLHAAKLLRDGALTTGSVTALGGFRPIRGDEIGLVEEVAGVDVADEFHAMDLGVRRAFELSAPLRERGEDSELVGGAWRVHEYEAAGGLPVRVVAAPSSEPSERRANTPDTYAWFATELAHLSAGRRILVVTTDIYVPYQHAAAIRMLALPYGVTVETVGMQPGRLDPRLRQPFEPHNYLQEIRATIGALRALHAAL